MGVKSLKAIEIFFSYSHIDEKLFKELGKHVELLKEQKNISDWHDRRITAGTNWHGQIDEHLNSADIILLLVSIDFLVSGYIKDVELKQASNRHRAGKARVIPVILRKCSWEKSLETYFGKLQALPDGGKPVTLWPNRDVAFDRVAIGIGLVIDELRKQAATSTGTRSKDKGIPKGKSVSEIGAEPRALYTLRGRRADSELSHEEIEMLVEDAATRANELVPDSRLRSRICQAGKVALRENKGHSLSKEQLEQLDERFLRKREKRRDPDPKKIRWVLRAAHLHPQGRRIVIPRRPAKT